VKTSKGGEASQPAPFSDPKRCARPVLLRRRGDLFEGDLLLAFLQSNSGGPGQLYGFTSRADLPPTTVPIHLNLTREQLEEVTRNGFRVELDLVLAEATHRV
jgi:hypothetical protein